MARLFILVLVLQTGCAIAASSVFGKRSEERYVLRPKEPDARLTCDGRPCSQIRGTRTTSRESVAAFVVAAAAEAGCTFLAARSYHQTGAGEMQAVADVCGGLLIWDLATVPLAIPLSGMFIMDRHSDRFDSKVRLSLAGRSTELRPDIVAYGGVFSAQAELDHAEWMERMRRQIACKRSGRASCP